ncbi:hypothetical protein DL93DRAFT_2094044 [Clavulina sp. PMI_390]|nr:hypothetical protein DL93DRAFT_2094044 [Clavulina sp. PMI_390]
MDGPIALDAAPATLSLDVHASSPQFTCLSCLIAFPNGESQRAHYRSDHHRYNMKRRVAGLPPISALSFNQKVLDKRAETALTTADRGATCEVCNKTYSSENAYRSHIVSKRHKENELKLAERAARDPSGSANAPTTTSDEVPSAPEAYSSTTVPEPTASTSKATAAPKKDTMEVDEEDDEDDEDAAITQTLDERLAAARSRIGPLACLFCSSTSSSVPDNLEHMAKSHGFFIPDVQYLEDLPGLITYLAEKVAIGNACLYCNREYRSLHAVRKHMIDKSHTKIAYDSEKQRLEISDFYDFTTSYPDADLAGQARRNRATGRKTITAASAIADEQWEDDEDDEDVEAGEDESVYDVESEEDEEEILANSNLVYGDTPYELVLPSGARIGHRSMSRYYKQSFAAPLPSKHAPLLEDGKTPTGREIVRRILAEKEGVLVPASGAGFGAYGNGTMTIRARNRGEAKEAGRHVREFRDQKKREHFKTAVAFRNNNQKHFRDPLLQ